MADQVVGFWLDERGLAGRGCTSRRIGRTCKASMGQYTTSDRARLRRGFPAKTGRSGEGTAYEISCGEENGSIKLGRRGWALQEANKMNHEIPDDVILPGEEVFPSPLTTANPLECLRLVFQMQNNKVRPRRPGG